MKLTARMWSTLLLAALLLAAAVPAAAQRSPACPRIPSVSSDPLNRSYKAGDLAPAELLDPPFLWVECGAPSLPAGAVRSNQTRVVFLSVTVDETGAVVDARPRGAIDPEGFYDAAVAAIRSWRTNPPTWRGTAVKASIAVDVRFPRPDASAAEPPASTPSATTQPTAPATAPATTPPTPQPETAVPAVAAAPVSAVREEAPKAEPPSHAPQSAPVEPAATTQVSAPVPQPAPAAVVPAPVPAVVEPQTARSELRREPPVTTPSQARGGGEPFVVEYYYKVRWGFADEFWLLFNRNHWPLLQKQMELGRILEVRAARPRYHATEDGRWDYRVTIVFRSAAEANATFDTEALERQLFPDLEGYLREEKRRFELLLAHWDVPILAAALEP